MRDICPGSVLHIAAGCNLCDRIPFLLDREAHLNKKSENRFAPAKLAFKYAGVLVRARRDRA